MATQKFDTTTGPQVEVLTAGQHLPSVSVYGKAAAAGDTPVLVDSAGRQVVAGAAATGSAVAGSPVLTGGSDGTNARSLLMASGALSDALANPSGPQIAAALGYEWNGTAWDRDYGNVEGTGLASAARTATTATADMLNPNGRGVLVYLNVTVASGTGGLQVQVQAKDPVSGSYVSINASPAAVTTTGCKAYLWYPGAATGGGISQTNQQPVPRTFRLLVSVGDGSSYTYSVGYCLLD